VQAKSDITIHQAGSEDSSKWSFPALLRQPWCQGSVLALLVFVAYQQVWHAGFIWDDDMHITENPCIVGPQGFWDIWTSAAARIGPLVISSFWLEYHLWGLNPLPYHLLNVAVHAVNALLLWRVLLALRVRGAWLGAALWALHPVQVETAAWITELKNTQSCFFYLLTILFFVKWLERRHNIIANKPWRWYVTAMLCCALAMASKSSTVVLPLMLGLVWWWMERGWRWRNALWLVPPVLFAASASAVSVWTQTLEGGIVQEWHRPLAERVITAGAAVWFYLGKLAWPHPLIFIYPRWEMRADQVMSWVPVAALVFSTVLLWRVRETRWRPVAMMLACFVAALVPVLGLVDHYFLRYSFVGDHFQYLASMAPLALLGAALVSADAWLRQLSRHALPVLGTALLVLLMSLTWRHSRIFETQEILWEDTLVKNPACWMAHTNFGMERQKRGDYAGAQAHYESSAALYGGDHEVHNNLGTVLLNAGKFDEAIKHCRKAIEIRSDCLDARLTLSASLWAKGAVDDALAEWNRTIELAPGLAEAHANLGGALLQLGRVDEALAHCQRAVEIEPENPSAYNNLGAASLRAGRLEESLAAYRKAVQLDDRLGSAHYNLAQTLRAAGRGAEAVPHYEKAVELMPDSLPALNNLAWVRATIRDERLRNAARARTLAERANALTEGRDASVFRTLAAAYAAAGDYAGADQQVELGLFIAGLNNDEEIRKALQSDRELYRKSMSLVDLSLSNSVEGTAR